MFWDKHNNTLLNVIDFIQVYMKTLYFWTFLNFFLFYFSGSRWNWPSRYYRSFRKSVYANLESSLQLILGEEHLEERQCTNTSSRGPPILRKNNFILVNIIKISHWKSNLKIVSIKLPLKKMQWSSLLWQIDGGMKRLHIQTSTYLDSSRGVDS